MSLQRAIIDCVGLEFESSNLTEESARRILSNKLLYGWKAHHDSSIITNKVISPYIPFPLKAVNNSTYRSVSCGTEIVSPPIDTVDNIKWMDQVKFLLDELNKLKEVPANETSFHVHVNCGQLPFFVIQNFLRVWKIYESIVYRVSQAELGYHRGSVRKDYTYCRPILSPHVVRSDNGTLRYSYDVEKMLKAKSRRELFQIYGNTDCNVAEPRKYSPVRYSAINLHPLLSLGTIEFRTFNMTTDYRNIEAWVDLCKSLIKTSMGKPLELPDRVLGFNGDFNTYEFSSHLEIPDKSALNLERLFLMNGWCEPVKSNLFTHSSENFISWDLINQELVPDSVNEAVLYTSETTTETILPENINNQPRRSSLSIRYMDLPETVRSFIARSNIDTENI